MLQPNTKLWDFMTGMIPVNYIPNGDRKHEHWTMIVSIRLSFVSIRKVMTTSVTEVINSSRNTAELARKYIYHSTYLRLAELL